MTPPTILHAGLLAQRLGGLWTGVLIAGSSGAGKSDLMIRAMDAGFRLVSDDRTLVWACAGALFGRAPESIAGLIELRGLGVVREPGVRLAQIVLMVRCEDEGVQIERSPDDAFETVGELRVPAICLRALDASAPVKLGRALRSLGHGRAGA